MTIINKCDQSKTLFLGMFVRKYFPSNYGRFCIAMIRFIPRPVASSESRKPSMGARRDAQSGFALNQSIASDWFQLHPFHELPVNGATSFLVGRQNTGVSCDSAKKTVTKHPLDFQAPSNKRVLAPSPLTVVFFLRQLA